MERHHIPQFKRNNPAFITKRPRPVSRKCQRHLDHPNRRGSQNPGYLRWRYTNVFIENISCRRRQQQCQLHRHVLWMEHEQTTAQPTLGRQHHVAEVRTRQERSVLQSQPECIKCSVHGYVCDKIIVSSLTRPNLSKNPMSCSFSLYRNSDLFLEWVWLRPFCLHKWKHAV